MPRSADRKSFAALDRAWERPSAEIWEPWWGTSVETNRHQYLDAKSPQPLRVCGLAWNSGGAGIRSVAVGLHQVLGVGELVELIDVGLGNHDVDGREHE